MPFLDRAWHHEEFTKIIIIIIIPTTPTSTAFRPNPPPCRFGKMSMYECDVRFKKKVTP